MAWKCSTIVNPTAVLLRPRGLPSGGGHRPCFSARRTARLSADVSAAAAAAARSCCGRARRLATVVSARQDDSADGGQQPQPLNFSVLRFTLGIPGLDESYLPRYIGWAFGTLIVLNHLLGSNSPTPAQLRSEALGICLSAFSIALPYLGKFLRGASPADRSIAPEGNRQIFAITEDTPDAQKEDLAWASYVILQNTNTVSLIISSGEKLCVRGFWNVPEDASKAQILDSLEKKIRERALRGVKEALYFPLGADSQLAGILPEGARSVLLQPTHGGGGDEDGFILLASNVAYAYRESDREWIKAVANKFRVADRVISS